MTTAFFIVSIVSAVLVLNAFFPRRDPVLLLPSFMSAWLTIELAPWWLVWQTVIVAVFAAEGAIEGTKGVIGLALAVASAVGLVVIFLRTRRTVVTMRDAMGELDTSDAPRFPGSLVFFPILMRHRRGVVSVRNIVFAIYGKKKIKLDVVKADDARPGDLRPGVLQIHGGGWVMGDKREQGIPLLQHLAANGWVGVNANYRLSPKATFPDHLIDLKRAIAWYREHAEEHGADPDFLCVTGGSAGGHLCALVALTANDVEYQEGFESADTTMHAAVPFYGVYDFTNRNSTWPKRTIRQFFEPVVMKKKLSEDPEAFAKASPMDQVRKDAPPFFVVHGDLDTLAPVADARDFVDKLRAVSDAPVLYAEMKGAEHAFDVFPSYRTARVIEGIERFLHSVHQQYLEGRTHGAVSEREAAEELVEN
ncbi:MAG TPA: alpha/beta hydrolase [Acidimicrobiales bacterium]|nr:alpha/beta hydrolase [Acidimicrobiales bacterium]